MHVDESEATKSSIVTQLQESGGMFNISEDSGMPTLFSVLYDLALILGQVLHLLKHDNSDAADTTTRIKRCSASLDQWFETAKTLLPSDGDSLVTKGVHQTVMFIYYL